MPSNFQYDVFISHSGKDKAAVRPLAVRLRQDGLKMRLAGDEKQFVLLTMHQTLVERGL